MWWYVIAFIIIILVIMSKKSRNKESKKQKRKAAFYEALNTFKNEFPLLCKGKTLSQIINEYCNLMRQEQCCKMYKGFFTEQELNSIYNI